MTHYELLSLIKTLPTNRTIRFADFQCFRPYEIKS